MKKLMVIRSGNTTAFGDFRTHVLRSNSYTPEQRASWKTHKKVWKKVYCRTSYVKSTKRININNPYHESGLIAQVIQNKHRAARGVSKRILRNIEMMKNRLSSNEE